MKVYRPLRGILLIYELFRLAVLVLAARAAPAGEGAAFPSLVYGAANALFLLMALFVWLDPFRYGVYAPLYAAGKLISAVSALGWCVFSWQRIVNNVVLIEDSGILTVTGLLLLIATGDILSACGGAILIRKLKREASLQPVAAGPIAEDTAAEDHQG
jgi:hypothetical protein